MGLQVSLVACEVKVLALLLTARLDYLLRAFGRFFFAGQRDGLLAGF